MNKNILFLIDKNGFGGVQTIADNLIKNKLDDHINMYYFYLRNISRSEKKYNNVFCSNTYSKYNPLSFFELKNIIKEKNIDIIHMNGDKATFMGILVKKIYFSNLKIIHHEHGGVFRNYNVFNLLLRILKSNINLFIAVSESIKRELINKIKISEGKIKVIYNFVDFNQFSINNIKSNKQKNNHIDKIIGGDFIIGFVGRLKEIKGCEYLIKSLPYLNFKYKVIIVGDGVLKNELKQLAHKLGVGKQVLFLGYVRDTSYIYPLIDICVMPSLSEASPMVFYEAQAFGIPIIGSNVPAINEFIIPKKNGFLFEAKNIKDLANKINLLQNDRILRLDMKNYAIDNIRKYSLDFFIENLKKIYLDIKFI